jgi:DNA-binding NtrC family response regulator
MARILIADDEASIRLVLKAQLSTLGHSIHTVSNGREALIYLQKYGAEVLITDLNMPKMGGMELFTRCRTEYPDMPVIILTAHGTVHLAVDAIKKGAFDFQTKPFDKDELRNLVQKALTESNQRQTLLHEGNTGRFDIIGKTQSMQEVYTLIERVSKSTASVLIIGESGTGKELVAKALHRDSTRSSEAFIQVNCGAIPEQLFESEFFGFEKGSFTGAHQSKPGKFMLAHKGTIFLDEIGELPTSMQVKLLRVLQDGSIERVGGKGTKKVDVRLVAATNRDLNKEVQEGRFREDLYYRLNVVPITLPPLRERLEDVPLLAAHFLKHFSKKFDRAFIGFTEKSISWLTNYDWPGNIRELENVLERSVLLCDDQNHHLLDITQLRTLPESHEEQPANLKEYIRRQTAILEKKKIELALSEHDGNVTHAANALGISRKSLQLKMRDYNLRS